MMAKNCGQEHTIYYYILYYGEKADINKIRFFGQKRIIIHEKKKKIEDNETQSKGHRRRSSDIMSLCSGLLYYTEIIN